MSKIENKIIQFTEACLLNDANYFHEFLSLLEEDGDKIIIKYNSISLDLPFNIDYLAFELLKEAYIQGINASELVLALKCANTMYFNRKRKEPNLIPVWTGPSFSDSPIVQKTYDTVLHLFQKAKYEIFIVGYAFSLDDEAVKVIINELITAANRGCRINIIFHQNTNNLKNILKIWPDNLFLPNLYYWNGNQEDKWASLHSKLILIDQEKLFLGSANFTNHGFHKNIETGLIVENHPIVPLYWRQFRSLLDNKEMKQL